jgi:hypothetical protein
MREKFTTNQMKLDIITDVFIFSSAAGRLLELWVQIPQVT